MKQDRGKTCENSARSGGVALPAVQQHRGSGPPLYDAYSASQTPSAEAVTLGLVDRTGFRLLPGLRAWLGLGELGNGQGLGLGLTTVHR